MIWNNSVENIMKIHQYPQSGPLALGFPLETTIAVTKMYLSRVFDRYPNIKILLAHSGGTLPFLAGRIGNCVAHERKFVQNEGSIKGQERSIWEVLKQNIYHDAVVYGEPGFTAAVEAAGSAERVMFATDNPFFPLLNDPDEEWLSVRTNQDAIESAFEANTTMKEAILGCSAVEVLGFNKTNPT